VNKSCRKIFEKSFITTLAVLIQEETESTPEMTTETSPDFDYYETTTTIQTIRTTTPVKSTTVTTETLTTTTESSTTSTTTTTIPSTTSSISNLKTVFFSLCQINVLATSTTITFPTTTTSTTGSFINKI